MLSDSNFDSYSMKATMDVNGVMMNGHNIHYQHQNQTNWHPSGSVNYDAFHTGRHQDTDW